MGLRRKVGQLCQCGRSGGEQVAAVTNQFVVPEGELFGIGQPFADALQEVVTLGEHALEARARGDIGAIHLGQGYVDIAPPSGGRSGNEVDVRGGEQHSGEPPYGVRQAL